MSIEFHTLLYLKRRWYEEIEKYDETIFLLSRNFRETICIHKQKTYAFLFFCQVNAISFKFQRLKKENSKGKKESYQSKHKWQIKIWEGKLIN